MSNNKYTIGYFAKEQCYKVMGKSITDDGLDDFVTIMAKSNKHAARYYEVCFALWREQNKDPIEGGHNTQGVTWKGTPEDGYAVLPDNYKCDCHECDASGKIVLQDNASGYRCDVKEDED